MFFVLYLVVSALARLVASSADAGSKDIEILVLRPQPKVLRRKTGQTLATPEGSEDEVSAGSSDEVGRRDLFGGLIHDSRAVAA